mgnify:CR=1 FL=1
MKLDVLVCAAHPDDAELSCGGTILKLTAKGKKVGILDLTRGELGTRGTPEIRAREATAAAEILGISDRRNAGLPDGFFQNSEVEQKTLIPFFRYFRPEVILCNAPSDRHPDHGRAAVLVKEAAFLSGLRMIATTWEGQPQQAWRPKKVFHYIQDQYHHPSFVVDITSFYEKKVEAVKAFSSQFHNPASQEPETYISSPTFLRYIEARAIAMGHHIQATYGEGFIAHTPLAVHSPLSLVS